MDSLSLDHSVPEPLPVPEYNPVFPAISANGDRLAFVESSEDLDIWRADGPAHVHDRAGTAQVPSTRLISSTLRDTNPQYSPDGSHIAFTSSRSGTTQIWVCESDGSNPVQLTNFENAATPRWSPDSRYIAFDAPNSGSADIYVISAQGGPARRITPESSQDEIVLRKNSAGTIRLWRMRAVSGSLLLRNSE